MEKVLELRNVSKSFGKVSVFRNIDLELYRGEILALVGENGVGKSTMMNLLGGVYPFGQYEGDIYVKEKICRFRDANDSKMAGIEMIHQEISLHTELTVAENVLLGNWNGNHGFIKWKNTYEEAEKYLKKVKLDMDPKTMVYNLSTSQQQLLSIAKALATNPQIVLFDEPTSALTETDADNLIEIIKDLSKNGISCIYISHKLDEVFALADRISVLRDGNLISTYRKEEVSVDRIIEDMVGRKLEEMYPKKELPVGAEELRAEGITIPHPYVKNRNLVEEVSFSVAKGEILGFSGLVGSGRSETMNAVFGSLKKSAGTVYLEGNPVNIRSAKEAIKMGIGMVTEDRKKTGIIAPMNLRENMTIASLDMISNKTFINRKKEKSISGEFYEKLSVKANGIEDNIMNLSGGNQQKIVLSKWLMKDIRVLILDEPTRGVDVGAKVEIYNIITELAEKGIAVIMVSSELPELLGMCDRIIVLSRGRVTGNIKREDFSQERIMRAATGLETYGI